MDWLEKLIRSNRAKEYYSRNREYREKARARARIQYNELRKRFWSLDIPLEDIKLSNGSKDLGMVYRIDPEGIPLSRYHKGNMMVIYKVYDYNGDHVGYVNYK